MFAIEPEPGRLRWSLSSLDLISIIASFKRALIYSARLAWLAKAHSLFEIQALVVVRFWAALW